MMTPENFCYWLQGFVEIGEPVTLNKQQLQVLKDHLKLVFDKKTPDRSLEANDETFVPYTMPRYILPYRVNLSKDGNAVDKFSMDQSSVSYTETPLVSYNDIPISC